MRRLFDMRYVGLLALAACGSVSEKDVDASVSTSDMAKPIDMAAMLGTQQNPANSCTQLLVEVGPTSGVYWLKHPDGSSPPLEVYCEQQINQGGWVLLYNSVHSPDGLTTPFWRMLYAQRLDRVGTPATDRNFYDGRLYPIGRSYMDYFVDMGGVGAVAVLAETTGIDTTTMAFMTPSLVAGNQGVYDNHYAAGWSSLDADHDPYGTNCAVDFQNVMQHYSTCWHYNLGADADADTLDGGVGPHVSVTTMNALGLTANNDGSSYTRVGRIARYTKW